MTATRGLAVPFVDLGAMHRELAGELDAAWRDVTTTGAFVGGEEVAAFERAWAAYCGTRHAVGVANGTDALALVLRALGVGPASEVVVPANTFVATCEAVVLAGATPRFADVDPATLLVTAETIEQVVGPRTAAIVPVHLFGGMPAMGSVLELGRAAGIPVVEDAAQAHGATYDGRRAGSLGVAGCFSFYPAKNLGAFGDAGAVVTDDASLAERVRSMADHGRAADDKYQHPHVGTNSRLDGLQAAVLNRKLARLDAWNAERRRVAARYRERLGSTALVPAAAGVESVHHLAVVRVPQRDRVRAGLAARGIETGIHYPVPCHRQPPYRRYATGALPAAETACDEILSLPVFPHMSDGTVDEVCAGLQDVLDEVRDGR